MAACAPQACTHRAARLPPRVLKLLSEDPSNYPDAPREGIRRVLEEVTGVPHPRCAHGGLGGARAAAEARWLAWRNQHLHTQALQPTCDPPLMRAATPHTHTHTYTPGSGQPLDTSRIASIRMGTTVATNALLERKGERSALLVTAGFPDLLHIANQVSGAAGGRSVVRPPAEWGLQQCPPAYADRRTPAVHAFV